LEVLEMQSSRSSCDLDKNMTSHRPFEWSEKDNQGTRFILCQYVCTANVIMIAGGRWHDQMLEQLAWREVEQSSSTT
jgi:hypothetical protein